MFTIWDELFLNKKNNQPPFELTEPILSMPSFKNIWSEHHKCNLKDVEP